VLVAFVGALFRMYMALHYVYLEINPLVVLDAPAAGGAAAAGTAGASGVPSIVPLDMAAKLDEAAAFLAGAKWGADLAFPPPFGR
jgi:ATP citrate (pro-S)-lyase